MDFEKFIDSNDAIFHYTKNEAFLQIIKNMRLRLSPLEKMNDPMEYKRPPFTFHQYGDANRSYECENEAWNKMSLLKLNECKIACFCSNYKYPIKAYLRSRMWSQYGENHEGVCLVFSKKAIKNIVDKNDKFEIVSYKKKFNSLLEYDFFYPEIHKNNFIDNFFESKYKTMFFTKVIDYRDEAEFRLLKRVKDKNKTFAYIDIKKCLKCILIGDKFNDISNPVFNKLRENEYNIEVRKCEFDTILSQFRLEKIDI